MTLALQPNGETNSYQRALRSLRPGLAVAAAVSAVISVLMLTGSIYMLQVYDRVLASGSVPTLVGLFVIVVVLYGFLGLYDFLRSRILSRLAARLDVLLGLQAFQSWLGGAAAKVQPLRELDMLRGFLSGPAMPGLFDLPWVPLYLGVLFLVHPWLGWLTIAGAAVVAALAWIGHGMTQKLIARGMTDDAIARDYADRSQRNAEMIIAMGMLGTVATHWRALQNVGLGASQRAGNSAEVIGAISRAFRMLMQSAILTLGAYLVIQGQMSGGMIIASSILTGRALGPVDQVIGQWRGIGKAMEAHSRLKDFFATAQNATPALALPVPSGQICVTRLMKFASGPASGHGNVKGHADPDRLRLLDGISFDLAPGDAMGVVGSSGSGKSTLARLLVGAMAADGGEIRLDGATRQQFEPALLGRHFGYLPQQVDLLPGTLRDNIARFDLAVSDTEVMAAASLAGVHDMILRLPDGYATRIGGSVMLSGGQVQRVGLARALCGKPRLVVLDEPNSNLDAAGEECLTRAIAQLREAGSVVVVMTHRPNVLLATNKVLVLEAGRMIEFGEREALMVRPAEAALTDARPFTAAFPPPKPRVVSSHVDPALRNRAEESASGRPDIAAEGQGRQRAPGTSPDFQRRMRGFASEATPSALQQRGKP